MSDVGKAPADGVLASTLAELHRLVQEMGGRHEEAQSLLALGSVSAISQHLDNLGGFCQPSWIGAVTGSGAAAHDAEEVLVGSGLYV